MDIEKNVETLKKELSFSRILKKEPMNKHTTFKIGGIADIYINVGCIKDLQTILMYTKQNNIPLTVIGNGSNILVKDNGIRGIVINLNMQKYKIEKQEKKAVVTCDAGVKNAIIANKLLEEGISGFEFAHGIPGTIGGAVRMNAGAHGIEMKDIIINTTYMDYDTNIKTYSNKDQEFEYRTSIFKNKKLIIIGVKLELSYAKKEEIKQKMDEYKKYRIEKQPISNPSAGSTFKRGKDFITAKLIDECGLKGYKIGGAQISPIHAGFIINKENATAKDVLDLIEYTKTKVYEKYKNVIELEIVVLGE